MVKYFNLTTVADAFNSDQFVLIYMVFPGGSGDKEYACNVGAPVSIPGLGRSPGEGNDKPFEYSRLENSTDKGT